MIVDYLKKQQEVNNLFVKVMEKEYGIREITSETHKKNKTRMFKAPDGNTFGVYHSGMVRKVFRDRFGQLTCYQLNRTHNQETRSMIMENDGTFRTRTNVGKARIPIYGELARLNYLLQYLKKNYDLKEVSKTNNIKVIYDVVKPKEDARETITVNGVTYVRV